ncbi:MAG: transposase [Verrucomicrobia bacterium]|nr:transposase [Verrucomicrobiota bacterium]
MLQTISLEMPAPPAQIQMRPLPEDLLTWFGERTLVQLTLEAVSQVNLGSRTGVQGPDLLTLVCYCYARGVLGSRQIEWAARHDPNLRRLGGNVAPDWNTIRNFRRRNREAVLRTLRCLLASAHELRYGAAALEAALPAQGAAESGSLQAAWVLALQGATARIERAIHADSMALDE